MSFRFASASLVLAATAALAAVAPDASAAQDAAARAPAGQPIPISDFVRHARFASAKLSPTGKYLAITQQVDGVTSLAVLRADTLAPVGNTTLPDEKSIGQFYWVGPERLMFTALKNFGSRASPQGTGEWFSVDADGSKPRVLIHYGKADSTQRGKAVSPYEFFSMLDPRPGTGRPLMQKGKFGGSERVIAEVVSIDPVSGNRESLGRAPRENCDFALDEKKLPRWVNCSDSENAQGVFEEHLETYRREENGEWTLVNNSQVTGKRLNVIGTAPDGRVYALQDDRKAPAAFGLVDKATGRFTELFRDPVAEVDQFVTSADGETIIGVVTMAGSPKIELVDDSSPDVGVFASLAKGFPGKLVDFTSATDDGNKILVSVRDDEAPGELYLYDRASGKARFLLRNFDWLDASRMGRSHPFNFKTRDGHTMYGYITVPHGRKLQNLPMIINPHGGPIGPRDDWAFDSEAQLFASRGYAVLKLNYRGSGGYGQAFQDLGHGEWGGAMQDDLTDVTRWAIEKGYADPERICIYGGSYGGYAALMGAAKEPDLYACAAGYVGVYDMIMMNKKGDIRQSESGRRFLERTMGENGQQRLEFSPAHQAAKIKAPVFLAAGMKDARAPYQHTEAMRDALIKVGRPPEEVLLVDHEGHGFYKEANNIEYYTKLLNFFHRHIGNRDGKVTVEPMERVSGAPANPSTEDNDGE